MTIIACVSPFKPFCHLTVLSSQVIKSELLPLLCILISLFSDQIARKRGERVRETHCIESSADALLILSALSISLLFLIRGISRDT